MTYLIQLTKDLEEKRARFEKLEAQSKADETDWVVFFESVDALKDFEDAAYTEYHRQEPGFCSRLRTKITKRG